MIGQDFVTIDGQLWAVNGDPDDHGSGDLVASRTYVTIGGRAIIVAGDSAMPDDLCIPVGGAHCTPYAVGFDDMVDVGAG